MKILLEHGMPFQLAHGGYQIQIEQTKRGLEQAGLEVEWLRWWDDSQTGDIIQAFSPITAAVPYHAREKRIPVVLMTLLSGLCDLPPLRLHLKALQDLIFKRLPGIRGSFGTLPQQIFHLCTHNLVNIHAEARVMEQIYHVPSDRITVIPGGLSKNFLQAKPATKEGDYLICTATITERKNSVELARLAKLAEVPVLFVGKPYHPSSPYWRQFRELIDNRWVRYREHISSTDELIALLRSARGFVINSLIETWCFSAHEAAVCGLPVLLPDQKWSRELFGDQATYLTPRQADNAAILRNFHRQAADAPAPRIQFWSWKQIGEQHAALYKKLLNPA